MAKYVKLPISELEMLQQACWILKNELPVDHTGLALLSAVLERVWWREFYDRLPASLTLP